MSEHFFGLHKGHLKSIADKIAEKHGAWHVNCDEPTGEKCGWFGCPNRGFPYDGWVEKAVMAEIEAAGGIDSMKFKRKGGGNEPE